MITEWFLNKLADLVDWLMGGLPHVDVPSWLDTSGPVATVFGFMGSMGVWFPVTLMVTVLGALLTAWLVGFGIKGARIVASFLTLGGGSAA